MQMQDGGVLMANKLLFSIVAVASIVFGQTGLTGTTWRVTMLNGTPIGAMTYTINFKATDSTASGKIDCNSCGWRYKTNGSSISITGGFCTEMACPGESRAGEYEAALLGASAYTVNNSNLVLMKSADTTAVFSDEASRTGLLVGTKWILQKLNHTPVDITRYKLWYPTDSTASAGLGMNSCQYKYAAYEGSIAFSQARCTLLVYTGRDGEFVAAIDSVTRWILAGQQLFLLSASDTIMECVHPSTQGITGKLWQLQSIRQASGTTTITTPDKYTALFDTDSSVSILADCNSCTAACAITPRQDYIAGALSVSAPVCTKMYCGAASKDGLFTSIISNVAQYWISGNKLYCYADTDTLVFTQKTFDLRQDGFHPAIGSAQGQYTVRVSGNRLSITGLGKNVPRVRLFDLRGICVRQEIAPKRSMILNTRGLSRGIYLVQVVLSQRAPVTIPVHLAK